MAKVPEHIRLMLERCVDDPQLVLTASCGCSVSTVIYNGEQLPLVDVCVNHKDDVVACTEPDSSFPMTPDTKYLN